MVLTTEIDDPPPSDELENNENSDATETGIPEASNSEIITRVIADALDVNNATFFGRPTLPPDFPAYVEPTLAKCAHLVFQGSDSVVTHSRPACGNVGDIYLGPKKAALPSALPELRSASVGGIVNCTIRVPCYFQENTNILYCTVAVHDEFGADILTYLDGATTFLHTLLSQGKNVYVHCEMGISRSSTVVMAYLMKYQGMSRDEAYLHVKARRPKADPNPGFWAQLKRYEEMCRSTTNTPANATNQNSKTQDPPGPNDTTINIEWAKLSSAMFATCHQIPETLANDKSMQPLSLVTSPETLENALCVCLDFVWGRGVLEIDIAWFSFVCQLLDRNQLLAASSCADMVKEILQNEESPFGEIWAGEIYPNQIQRVVEKLNSTDLKTTTL